MLEYVSVSPLPIPVYSEMFDIVSVVAGFVMALLAIVNDTDSPAWIVSVKLETVITLEAIVHS